MMRTVTVGLMMIAAALTGASLAAAGQQRALPAFSVAAADGTVRASGSLSAEPKWVLLYVTPGCRSCDRLLQALKDWQSPQLIARTIVIVRGQAGPAAAYMGERLPPEAAGVAWFADPSNEAAQAMDLRGAPVLVGVDHGQVNWTISGVLNDPKSLESVVRTWVEY